MIREYRFANFFSFREPQCVRFGVGKSAPDTPAYAAAPDGARFGRILAVFGHNASGKTNLLRVLPFARWFMADSHAWREDSPLPFQPFVLRDGAAELPAEVVVDFDFDGATHRLEIRATQHRVLEERLSRRESKQFKTLYRRAFEPATKTDSLEARDFGLSSDFARHLKPNASVVAVAAHQGHGPSVALRDYWSRVYSNVSPAAPRADPETRIQRASAFFQRDPDAAARAQEIISALDLGLAGFRIQEAPGAGQAAPHFTAFGVHRSADAAKTYEIAFGLESKGTRNLFGILPQLISVLTRGGVMCYDEFEADLHPAMLPHLVGLFTDARSNPGGAQMIFSCHATQLMERLDKFQIMLAEKAPDGSSRAWRLDEMKGIRAGENYHAKYQAGAYGGVGDIDLI